MKVDAVRESIFGVPFGETLLVSDVGEQINFMTTLSNVYMKFGEVAEAAQLLETEVGNVLLWESVTEHDLMRKPDPVLARNIFADVDRKTLGQLIRAAQAKVSTPDNLEDLLERALRARNRLNHVFYRRHNFRRNSDEGRAVMLKDLEHMHDEILGAYKALLRLSDVELDKLAAVDLPSRHLPL